MESMAGGCHIAYESVVTQWTIRCHPVVIPCHPSGAAPGSLSFTH